jgi:DNA-binding Xre family transcriptional regulator
MIVFNLRALLDERGMSLMDLQRRTWISYSALHALYHNQAKGIRLDTLTRLAEALNVKPGRFFVDADDITEHRPER